MQAGNCFGRGNLHRVIGGRVPFVFLETGEEERLVLTNRAAGRESENIVAEDGLRNARQPVEIGNRIEALRLVSPQQSAVQIVGTGFRDYIEDAPARAPELNTEVSGLNRHFLYGIGDAEYLLRAA